MPETINVNELEEGCLYTYRKGELHEVQTDPDDIMKKVKITESAFAEVIKLQRSLRREMQGYKPDVHLICSALIEHAANLEDVHQIVRRFCLRLFEATPEVEHPST